MSTTNWYAVRNELATRLRTESSLRTVKTAPTEVAADTMTISYPGAVVVRGSLRRVGEPYGGNNSLQYITRVEFHVFYYTSEGLSEEQAETQLGTLANAGRLKLEAFVPTTQGDNSSLLIFESEDEVEKWGARGDGSDGLKVKQTYSLDQVAFSTPA